MNFESANTKKIRKFRFSNGFSYFFIIIILVGLGIVVTSSLLRFAQDNQLLHISWLTKSPTNQTITQPNGFGQLPGEQMSNTTQPTTTSETSPTTSAAQPQPGDPRSTLPASQPSAAQQTTQNGVPVGVLAIIDSMEANGLKNNPYVALDLSSIPDNTTVKFDRSSWSASSANSGTMNGTLFYQGLNKTGTLSFQLNGGSWQVTGYSINP